MITLPPIKKKEIPRQYFAALDHLNGGLFKCEGHVILKKGDLIIACHITIVLQPGIPSNLYYMDLNV